MRGTVRGDARNALSAARQTDATNRAMTAATPSLHAARRAELRDVARHRRPDPRAGRVREAHPPAAGHAREAAPAAVRRAAGRPRRWWPSATAARSSRSRSSSPTSRPSSPSPGSTSKTCSCKPAQRGRGIGQALLERLARAGRRARLRPLRVERARLERERDPLLRAHGRDRDARLAHLPRSPATALRGVRRDRPRELSVRSTATPSCTPAFAGRCRATSTSPRSAARAGRASTPDAVAIRFEHEDGRAHRLHLRRAAARRRTGSPHALRRLGVRRGDRVAHRDAAALRDRGRAHRALPARRGRDAAVDAVRPRRARVPARTTARRAWRSSTRAASPTCSPRVPLCPALATVIAVGARGKGRAISTGRARSRRERGTLRAARRRAPTMPPC